MHTLFEVHRHENQKLPFYFHKNMSRGGSSRDIFCWHPALEICRCISGKGWIICNSVRYPFQEGDVFVVNSNTLHKYISEERVVFDCLIIDESFFKEVDIDLQHIYFESSIQDPEMNRQMIGMRDIFASTKEYRTARIRSGVLNLLLYLCDNYAQPMKVLAGKGSVEAETAKIAIGYINAHLTDKLTLDILAKETGLNKYYLCHEFKKITSHTVFSYINLCRCEKAARLLLNPEISIQEICRACGFENASYFTRTFVKHYKFTPSEYRKSHR